MDSSSLPVFPPDPVQATKKTRTENVEIVQPQPPLIPVRQVRPLFPNGLPGITNLSSSIEQQTDDAIFKPFTKFFIELDEAIKVFIIKLLLSIVYTYSYIRVYLYALPVYSSLVFT